MAAQKTVPEIRKNEQNILLFLLMLAVMGIGSVGFGLFSAVCTAFLFMNGKNLRLPGNFILPVLFSVLCFFFVFPDSGILPAAKFLAVPLIWITGYNLPESGNIGGIFRTASVLAFGMAFRVLGNFIYNIAIGTELSSGRSLDIFSGKYSAATGQIVNATFLIAVLYWIIFCSKRKIFAVSGVFLWIFAGIYSVLIGSRSFIALSMLMAFLAFLLWFFGAKGAGRKIFAVLMLIFLSGIFAALFSSDFLGTKSLYENSYLFQRLEIHGNSLFGAGSRLLLKAEYLENFFRFPFGGNHIKNEVAGNYAHDLWLDIFDEAGIFAFFALVLFSVSSLLRMRRIYLLPEIGRNEKISGAVFTLVIFAQFFLEPIWQGAPLFFCAFLLIDGMFEKFAFLAEKGRF